MLVTENECTDIRCCGSSDCGQSREITPGLPKERFCIGSRCMAWRWFITSQHGDRLHKGGSFIGYCGLAGDSRR